MITVSDGDTMLNCVRSGLGKALLPVAVCGPHDDLIRVGKKIELRREIWTLVHPNQKGLARIEAVMTWLNQCLT